MKKKQILFLFAASALFAACSSDEMPTNNGSNEQGGGEETTEYLSSYTVTTEDGLGISVGAQNSLSVDTKSESSNVYFDLIPNIDDIMSQFSDYVVEADDFYIRRNGKYLDIVPMESGGAEMPGKNDIRITTTPKEGDLTIRVQKLDLLEYNPKYNDDYTFEVYIWVKKTTPEYEQDGSADLKELFTKEQKLTWIGGKENGLKNGIDITADSEAALLENTPDAEEPTKNPDGYVVRYNVYRGLSGYAEGAYNEDGVYIGPSVDDEGNYNGDGSDLGDTPYIKVSIHVNRLQNGQASSVVPVYPSED